MFILSCQHRFQFHIETFFFQILYFSIKKKKNYDDTCDINLLFHGIILMQKIHSLTCAASSKFMWILSNGFGESYATAN